MVMQVNGMGSAGTTERKLVDRMWDETREIHNVVENRQFIKDLMTGQVTDKAYLQYLVDLKYIYEALELALNQNKESPKIKPIALPELYRSAKLEKDIKFFDGQEYVFISPEAVNFAIVISECTGSKLHLLPAYAYLRLLGDLFGGTEIGAKVIEKWGEEGAAFYNYSELMEKNTFPSLPAYARMTYRPTFNQLQMSPQKQEALVKEAYRAFELTNEWLLSYERK